MTVHIIYRGDTMKLTALKYGVTELLESMAFNDGDSGKMIPISLMFFLRDRELSE